MLSLTPIWAADDSFSLVVTNAPRSLTLKEARDLAFVHNWDLLAAKSDVDQATAQRIVARQFPNPVLNYSTAKIDVDGHSSSTVQGNDVWERSYDTIFAVNQLFEIGGKRSSRQNSAKAGFEAATARLMDARRLLDLGVTRSYITVLLAEANAEILNLSASSLRREADIATRRLQAGDISIADRTQIELAAERFELDARTALATARSARVTVEVFLGSSDPRGEWVPGDSLEMLATTPPRAMGELPGAPRPDLVAAEAARRKAEADLKLQKALRIPDPTILLQYEHEPADKPNTIGIGVSLPLPLWNRNSGGIKSAEAARSQADLQIKKVSASIAAEVTTARIAYEDAWGRWRQYQSQIRPQSEQIRDAVSFAFEKGGASLLDLLVAQRNDNDIRIAMTQALADSASAAANLAAALNIQSQNQN